jgi:hypothetical protein
VSHVVLRDLRDHYLDELKKLTAREGANRFTSKAMILLTRHWAETHWSGRADLLQAAHWLIRVGADFHR